MIMGWFVGGRCYCGLTNTRLEPAHYEGKIQGMDSDKISTNRFRPIDDRIFTSSVAHNDC